MHFAARAEGEEEGGGLAVEAVVAVPRHGREPPKDVPARVPHLRRRRRPADGSAEAQLARRKRKLGKVFARGKEPHHEEGRALEDDARDEAGEGLAVLAAAEEQTPGALHAGRREVPAERPEVLVAQQERGPREPRHPTRTAAAAAAAAAVAAATDSVWAKEMAGHQV